MEQGASKVLVTGANGQLGRCLADTKPGQLHSVFLSSERFNLCDREQMKTVLESERPDYVLNCAAYTNVDGAQSNESQADQVNHTGLAQLAELCATMGAKLIHVSTDFVFDGEASKPYATDHPTAPLGVYGKTKHAGEEALNALMPETSMIIRTSWLYSEHGGNFVKTMLRLFDTKDVFSVVNDQFGSPTYARGLAKLMWHIVESGEFKPGTFHWSDAGVTSWYLFAEEIGNKGLALGLLENKARLEGTTAEEYGSVTPRPGYSALDCTKTLENFSDVEQVAWELHLAEMLNRLKGIEVP